MVLATTGYVSNATSLLWNFSEHVNFCNASKMSPRHLQNLLFLFPTPPPPALEKVKVINVIVVFSFPFSSSRYPSMNWTPSRWYNQQVEQVSSQGTVHKQVSSVLKTSPLLSEDDAPSHRVASLEQKQWGGCRYFVIDKIASKQKGWIWKGKNVEKVFVFPNKGVEGTGNVI